ncbi:MAG: hypothetical protein FJ115_02435 [Deltaproteobacteria bacterium]|nr:hypothetical protein [Deltaproteobacteria bacterium]MBM4322393.1 hypothetical protein [Deltaproteobacteria bacterium]MBM4346785.1 hypothetical protein [Deltaproteobacteria bacterium]
MIKKLLLTIFIVLATFTETFGFPVKVKDDLGREIEFSKKPERIVSLAPTHTEILLALGLQPFLVGVTDYCPCDCPEVNKEKQRIGGFANPDIERVLSLNPDLILSFGSIQKLFVGEFEKRGKKIFWINPHRLKDIIGSIERIGKITGTAHRAKGLKQNIEDRIKNIHEKLKTLSPAKRPALFRVMGLEPLGTIGGESFQTDVFHLAGGRNVFADIKKDYFELDRKTLFDRNPEVVVICGDDEETLKRNLREHPILKTLDAVKNDRIFVISCDLICRPGPRVAEAVEKIAFHLHPERFSSPYQRIISLGPSVTEQLCLLGLQNQLIGITTYCERPPEIKIKEKVGSVVEVNTEKIFRLKPDLVLATSLTNPNAVEKLKGLGIKVVSVPSPKSYEQLCNQFLELGRMTGRGKVAEKLVEDAKEKVNRMRKGVEGLPKPKVFVQVGTKPLFTVTGESFVNDFIKFAGGINIAQNQSSGLYSREEVLKHDPDVIIIVTMGIVGEEEKEVWQRYGTLKATQNNRIHIVDSNRVCSPTPVSFVETLEEIVSILHPEKKK